MLRIHVPSIVGASLYELVEGAAGIGRVPRPAFETRFSVYGLRFPLRSSIRPAGTMTTSALQRSLTEKCLRVRVLSMTIVVSVVPVNF